MLSRAECRRGGGKVLRRAICAIYGLGLIAAGMLCLRFVFTAGSAVLLAFTFVFALAILAGVELLWKGAFGED
jgi:heme O synthase-like polyprenyltransferase